MQIKRDLEHKKIDIIDETYKKVSSLEFIPSFFLWTIYTKTPIVLTKSVDEFFYHNLSWLLNNTYQFAHPYSYQKDNKLIWFSEHCYNIEEESERDKTSRLILTMEKDAVEITWNNPFYEKYKIKKEGITSFSPAGNGFFRKNLETGAFLQDDMIRVFQNTLYKKKI